MFIRASPSSQMEEGELVPLLIAAGGGGNGYLEDPESSPDHDAREQYETSTTRPSANGQTGAAGTLVLVVTTDTRQMCSFAHLCNFTSIC